MAKSKVTIQDLIHKKATDLTLAEVNKIVDENNTLKDKVMKITYDISEMNIALSSALSAMKQMNQVTYGQSCVITKLIETINYAKR